MTTMRLYEYVPQFKAQHDLLKAKWARESEARTQDLAHEYTERSNRDRSMLLQAVVAHLPPHKARRVLNEKFVGL